MFTRQVSDCEMKCLSIARLVYSASLLVIPNTIFLLLRTLFFSFIWNKKQDTIERDVMYQDYSNGGLRGPMLKSYLNHFI